MTWIMSSLCEIIRSNAVINPTGETVEVYQVATKGQEESKASWVTSYVLSISEDGSSFFNYTQGGQTRVRRVEQYLSPILRSSMSKIETSWTSSSIWMFYSITAL